MPVDSCAASRTPETSAPAERAWREQRGNSCNARSGINFRGRRGGQAEDWEVFGPGASRLSHTRLGPGSVARPPGRRRRRIGWIFLTGYSLRGLAQGFDKCLRIIGRNHDLAPAELEHHGIRWIGDIGAEGA